MSAPVKDEKTPDFLLLTIAPNESLRRCWDSLVGIDYVKEKLLNHMLLCVNPQTFFSWHKKFYGSEINTDLTLGLKSKTLLIGPSGTGKTTLARGSADALGRKLGKEVYFVEIGFTRSRWLGESSKNIVRAFNQVREWSSQKTVVFFLDEFDTVASTRVFEQQHEDVRASVNTLIKELDKVNSSDNVYILASSNLESHIDIAVKRRFDQIIEFKRPPLEERTFLLRKVLGPFREFHLELDCINDKDICLLAEKAQRYTQADIKNFVTSAIVKAVFEDKPLTKDHLLSALESVKPTGDYGDGNFGKRIR